MRSRLKQSVVGKTEKCNAGRCVTCEHVVEQQTFVGPRGMYTLNEKFTCKTAALVYCIICKRCGELYIGETGRKLCERFREHRRDVINNAPGKEVASHFNQEDHNGVEDMGVGGLKRVDSMIMRKLEEQKIIARLGCVLGGGMNTDFNFPFLFD